MVLLLSLTYVIVKSTLRILSWNLKYRNVFRNRVTMQYQTIVELIDKNFKLVVVHHPFTQLAV